MFYRKHGINNTFNDYVKVVEVIDIELILKNLFIPPYEDFEGTAYVDWEVLVVEGFGRTFAALHPKHYYTPDVIFSNKDGSIWVGYQGFTSLDLAKGVVYAGDEVSQVSKLEPYGDVEAWAFSYLSTIKSVTRLELSEETYVRILEKVGMG